MSPSPPLRRKMAMQVHTAVGQANPLPLPRDDSMRSPSVLAGKWTPRGHTSAAVSTRRTFHSDPQL